MTNRFTRRTLLGAALTPLVSRAADPSPVTLFDGKTLDGWSIADGPRSAFFVDDGAIVVHHGSNFPTWLRTNREYENFDFSCEVFIKGWANGGLYFAAPLYGRPTECGFKVNLFQKRDNPPLGESMGAIFPAIPPRVVNVKNQGEWNTVRVRMDWPSLRVWINDEMVQDLDCASRPELMFRRRSGFIGIESLSYPLRFRNLTIRELPGKENWTWLYRAPGDLAKWETFEKPVIETLGEVLRTDELGYLATKAAYRDFELDCYIRASKHSNGGVIFRSLVEKDKPGEHYEIQLHDVEGAVYPTGSLYGFARCKPYPRIEPEKWFPFQLVVKGSRCLVRVNGDTVVDYGELKRLEPGRVMLQAHQRNRWIEYQRIRIREL
jgi:hypothetical protein